MKHPGLTAKQVEESRQQHGANAAFGIDDYHAVTVTSVKKSGTGDVLGFYICDSANGGTTYYPASKVKRALTGSPMNVTYPIIR